MPGRGFSYCAGSRYPLLSIREVQIPEGTRSQNTSQYERTCNAEVRPMFKFVLAIMMCAALMGQGSDARSFPYGRAPVTPGARRAAYESELPWLISASEPGPPLETIMRRISSLTLTAAATASSPTGAAADGNGIFHVAIFRFAKEHINDAMTAFRALASASRREPGNLSYDIYRGIDDDQEFYVVEHWASPAALAAHEQTEAFIRFGQGVLVRYATLHDTVTAREFDVGRAAGLPPKAPSRK
jgi:quinol monooxygenase YgiN